MEILTKADFENPDQNLRGKYVATITEMMMFEEASKLWIKASDKGDVAVLGISMEDHQPLFGEKWGWSWG